MTDIRTMRTAAGLTQQQLAAEANCSLGYVAILERGYAPSGGAVYDRVVEVLSAPRTAAKPVTCLRLRAMREQQCLSRDELAARAGVSPAAIRNAERGIGTPRRETVEALAAALNCSAEDIA